VVAADFGSGFGDVTNVVWGGEAIAWPFDPMNLP
jgi:hypothetical protein